MGENGITKGFKVFNPDWACQGYQFEVGGVYEENVKPMVCDRGFHYCNKAADCFNYYQFNPENKVAEILALGEVDTDGTKSCTNKIQIVREVPWQELLEIVNMGKGCTGLWNSGNRNSGNWNSGDWNKTNFSNGCFNTAEPKIYLFNKPSEWTYRDWVNSEARCLMERINMDVLEWIWDDDMTDEEKAAHPEYATTQGYLKILDNSECCLIWWNGLSDREKNIILAIPNFDKAIFKEITGIDVD